MKKLLFIAALFSTLLVACNSGAPLKNNWKMVEFLGSPIDNEVFNVKTPAFNLNPDEGTFGGNNGCNQVNGKLEVDGNKISMEVLMGTRMFCNGVPEQEVDAKISEVDSYKIKGDKLFLFNGDMTLFVFELVEEE
ncbi:META domain-containing protein [Saccharicrinis aurantiacus]|uniref:META domain-containing protein n=1 Tax=Saccharicrinis aurantiacus TaxID=1849719 RepID=UPI002492911C|nr:META domain-containing protein [Saccharicrinis aurantiacus]